MKSGWRGIYSLHTKTNRYTQFTKLGQIDSVHNVTVRLFGGTDMSTRWDRIVKLGRTDLANNVTVRIFGGTDMVRVRE